MSRIGKKPIELSDKVKVTQKGQLIEVTGPNGTLNLELTGGVSLDIKDKEVTLQRADDSKKNRSLHGLYRSLINNMVIGVDTGFSRKLELMGIDTEQSLKVKI